MNLNACTDSERTNLRQQWLRDGAWFEQVYNPARLAAVTPEERELLSTPQFEQITKLVAALPARPLTRSELRAALARQALVLDDDSELWLYEQLEMPALTAQGERKREAFSPAATDPDVRAVFQAFLDAARSDAAKPPRIGVLTSAAREPMDAAAFYLAWFRALGADVVWIPLDGASRALRDRSEPFAGANAPCANLLAERRRQTGLSVTRQAEPALWQQYCAGEDLKPLLQTLDGLFFNGGDQSLHLAALLQANGTDSPELALIRARHLAGELAIMGTSAGTAVQTGNSAGNLPMISNGSSEFALRHEAVAGTPRLPFCALQNRCPSDWQTEQLRYRPQGGLRLFDGGILDTHFSQRGRMARMLMLLADTGAPIGVGVDETTALLARREGHGWTLEVVGKHGVWLTSQSGNRAEFNATAHYIHRGDRAGLTGKQIAVELATCGPVPVAEIPSGESIESGIGIHQSAAAINDKSVQVGAVNRQWRFNAGEKFLSCQRPDGAISYRDLRILSHTPKI